MRRIYTVNNLIHEIIYFALLYFFSFYEVFSNKQNSNDCTVYFLRQYALLFFTHRTQIIQRYIKSFTPALWHYIRQIILIPWHVQSVLLEK